MSERAKGVRWVANVDEKTACAWATDLADTVCVSITEPGREAPLAGGFARTFRMEFQDYDPHRKCPPDAALFTERMAKDLAIRLCAWRDLGLNILVHCAAGISRSGGVVSAILQAFPGEYEDRGWSRMPNAHVKVLLLRAMGAVPADYDEPDRARYEPGKNGVQFTNDPIHIEEPTP